ncbi:MAG: hypothetical protein IT361_18495 [Gemmatimonadaceae bacterium]|nr:hypothetical protein [Gemmatimonadaceae bacterium]
MLTLPGCSREWLSATGSAAEPFDRTVMVTAAVSRLLDSAGRVPSRHATVAGAIAPARAAQLAEAYIRLFGPQARTWIEGLRGEPVDFRRLHADPYVLLSESPFEVPDEGTSPPERKRAGPYYIVTLRTDGQPIVTVAVSALSSDIVVDSMGVRTSAEIRGNDFLVWPVPERSAPMPALTAEEAMSISYRSFGQPVDALPIYERKGLEFLPQEGAWRLELAGAVEVRPVRGVSPVRTRVVYVVDAATFAIASNADMSAGVQSRQETGSGGALLRYRDTAARSLVEVRPVTRR